MVIKALATVASVNPNLIQIGSPIAIVESTTTTLSNAIQTPTAGTNPQKIVDAFSQTAQAATNYLTALKSAPENEKQRALAGTKTQLQETLKVWEQQRLLYETIRSADQKVSDRSERCRSAGGRSRGSKNSRYEFCGEDGGRNSREHR